MLFRMLGFRIRIFTIMWRVSIPAIVIRRAGVLRDTFMFLWEVLVIGRGHGYLYLRTVLGTEVG